MRADEAGEDQTDSLPGYPCLADLTIRRPTISAIWNQESLPSKVPLD